MNVVDAILFHARQTPAAAAICAPGRQLGLISYGRLQAFVHNIARHALLHRLQRGQVVAILVTDPIFHLALVLGLMRIGVVTLSARDPNLPPECRVDAVLSDANYPFENANAGQVIAVDMTWTTGEGAPPDDRHLDRGEDNLPCSIALTSGTTGAAKAVAFTHRDFLERIARYNYVWGARFPNCSRMFSDLGVATHIGLLLVLHMLLRGGTAFLRGGDAADTMQAFDLYKVQCMVAPPGGLAEFLGYYEASPGFSSPFDLIVSVGSQLSPALADRARARLCSHLMASYGSTEAHVTAAAPAHQLAGIAHAVGTVTPGATVEIVDAAGAVLAPGHSGFVRLRSECMATGYVGDPRQSEQNFRAGWFYSGDVGSLTADNVLVIGGRTDAVINLGGEKINPEKVESVLLSFPGVVHAAAFGRAGELGVDEVWAAVAGAADLDPEAVRAHCIRRLAPEAVPVRVLTLPDIPRNAAGKIDRRRLMELIAGR